MKVIHTFKKKITLELDYDEIPIARRHLNLHYVGDENCNHFVGGKYVAKYPEFENSNPSFVEAHYNVNRSQIAIIEVELLEDGTIRIKN